MSRASYMQNGPEQLQAEAGGREGVGVGAGISRKSSLKEPFHVSRIARNDT